MAVPRRLETRIRATAEDGPGKASAFPGPLAEGEHPVGDLGPGGEYEPFRISVRLRAPREGSSLPPPRRRKVPRRTPR